jgi:prepilin-type N-terminal cleavage/methylation domain-containing protein
MKKLFKEKMNEGFSLVELVMVMVILGILSAVAVPKMSAVLNRATVRAEKAVVDQIWAGAEQYAGDKLLEDGTESWPYHPLSTFGRTRNMNINLVLGIPDEDDEWQYNIESDGEGRVYHFRIDDEIWYYTYDSTAFELAEEPIRYIAQ